MTYFYCLSFLFIIFYVKSCYRGRRRPGQTNRNYLLVIGQFSQIFSSLLALLFHHPYLLQFHNDDLWRFFGIAVAATGVGLIKTGLNTLGESFNYIHDLVAPTRLVQDGIYRIIKHPIYLGNMLVSIGIFISAGTAWGIMGCIMVVLNCRQAIKEEEKLLLPLRKTKCSKDRI